MGVDILWNSLVLKYTKVVLSMRQAVHTLETFRSNNVNYWLKYKHRRRWEKISWTATFQHIYYEKNNNYILYQLMPFCKCFVPVVVVSLIKLWLSRRGRDRMAVRFTSFFIVLKNMFTKIKDVNFLLKICIYTMHMYTNIFVVEQ